LVVALALTRASQPAPSEFSPTIKHVESAVQANEFALLVNAILDHVFPKLFVRTNAEESPSLARATQRRPAQSSERSDVHVEGVDRAIHVVPPFSVTCNENW
jgi:hypothetical protein